MTDILLKAIQKIQWSSNFGAPQASLHLPHKDSSYHGAPQASSYTDVTLQTFNSLPHSPVAATEGQPWCISKL